MKCSQCKSGSVLLVKNCAQGFIHKIQQGSSNSRKATNLFSPNAQEYPNSQNWIVKKREINPRSSEKLIK